MCACVKKPLCLEVGWDSKRGVVGKGGALGACGATDQVVEAVEVALVADPFAGGDVHDHGGRYVLLQQVVVGEVVVLWLWEWEL